MKRKFYPAGFYLLILLTQFFLSCKKNSDVLLINKEGVSDKSFLSAITIKEGIKNFDEAGRQVAGSVFDNTGRLEVKVWADYSDGQSPHKEVKVDPEFVLIGGGARVSNFSNTSAGVNALLTSCYPGDDGSYSTFIADSKDHLISYPHRLWVYAIGLKMYDFAGLPIPASYVRSFMNISKATSSSSGHPTAVSYAPPGNIVLSGGARITWQSPGNLLIQSIPYESNGWIASGKDHLQASPAKIEAYVLSIYPYIPLFGTLLLSQRIGYQNTSHGVQGNITLEANPPGSNEWLISGVGGNSTYNGVGRMLFSLYPNSPTTAVINNKDHSQTDNGPLWGYIRMIKPL